ncbi:hypothetical protein CKO38_13915 [Rhodospirillum rubrum]|uniref:manganese efflux pump MntP n=1 Tax=Rhodospirillum rubrum TaxID=1085 RepID=UPI0019077184|nr:manganese efflux pump MntP family protein [Rhodospirillum rubrum]MBK1665663.1 hypothetical protein [Rhodospirillum rubrum]MBK1677744.1 hypothetical protein [Rhodospirillum rubrum]
MSLATLTVLGFSLSADAFAAALGKGASARRPSLLEAFRVGAYFGAFEAAAPLIGWALGLTFAARIAAFDHWVAFTLLAGVGGHMAIAALRDPKAETAEASKARQQRALSPLRLALAALATSIDATAVGIGLAVTEVNILMACALIGAITTVVAAGGVLLGRGAGPLLGRKAEVLGGLALIGIGLKILIEHLSA